MVVVVVGGVGYYTPLVASGRGGMEDGVDEMLIVSVVHFVCVPIQVRTQCAWQQLGGWLTQAPSSSQAAQPAGFSGVWLGGDSATHPK